jgi:hypothetical protein
MGDSFKDGDRTSAHQRPMPGAGFLLPPRRLAGLRADLPAQPATTSGGENYSMPTYTSAPGATSFDTPMLPVFETTYYFVVRARDRHGNEDANTVQREGQNVCE